MNKKEKEFYDVFLSDPILAELVIKISKNKGSITKYFAKAYLACLIGLSELLDADNNNESERKDLVSIFYSGLLNVAKNLYELKMKDEFNFQKVNSIVDVMIEDIIKIDESAVNVNSLIIEILKSK